PRRAERRREDDAPRSPDRTPGRGRGIRVPGEEPEDRLLRAGGGGARLLPNPPRGDQQRAESAAVASLGEGPPRPLLVPGGHGPQPRRAAQRRGTRAPRPREVHRPGLRPPRPRRADEPPRHREPGDPGRGPADVSGHGASREPPP